MDASAMQLKRDCSQNACFSVIDEKTYDSSVKSDSCTDSSCDDQQDKKFEMVYEPDDYSIIDSFKFRELIYQLPLSPTQVHLVNKEGCSKTFIRKIVNKETISEAQREKAREECVIHSQMKHKNIARMYHYAESSQAIEMILEYCNNYSYFEDRLEENSDPIDDNKLLKKYATEILEALEYIHSKGIVHADIKLANILLNRGCEDDEEKIKLIDFGLSLVTDPELKGKALMKTPVGTTGYMAPELKGKDIIVGPEIDMWAFGIVLYKMCVAYTPLQVPHYSYGYGPIPFVKRDWRKIHPDFQDLIRKCLEIDPAKRITSSDALKHEAIM